MKKKFLYFTFSLFILCLFLLGLEIFFRTTHAFGACISWSQPDPLFGWRFVRNRQFWSQEENPEPILWRTNHEGWKDKEWSVDKKPDTYRIAVLGDSYVEALQVAPEKNFPALAEKEMSIAGLKTEWMNFGHSGFGQAEEWLILQNEVSRFQPNLVILFFYPGNDLDDIHPKTAAYPARPFYYLSEHNELRLDKNFSQGISYRLKTGVNFLKQNSSLLSLLSRRISLLRQTLRQKKIRKQHQKDDAIQSYLSLCTNKPDPQYVQNYALSKRLIREMASFAKSKGMKFMLVVIDTPAYLPEIEAEYRKRDALFNPVFFENDLAALASELAIPYLSRQTPFRKMYLETGEPLHWNYWTYEGRPEYWEYGAHTGHWNEKGHAFVAELLREKKFV